MGHLTILLNLHKAEPPQNGVQLDQRDRQKNSGP
jgi:hypothetical protein